jgi:hypothetical protein
MKSYSKITVVTVFLLTFIIGCTLFYWLAKPYISVPLDFNPHKAPKISQQLSHLAE